MLLAAGLEEGVITSWFSSVVHIQHMLDLRIVGFGLDSRPGDTNLLSCSGKANISEIPAMLLHNFFVFAE